MSMTPAGQSPFDSIKHVDDSGEYWLARELMTALGYTGKGNWQNFSSIIDDAKTACASQGYNVGEVFSFKTKNPTKSGGRPSSDYRLTRFACYMIAMSGEGSKAEIAAAKVYFATKTQERERDEQNALDTLTAREEWKERAIRAFMAQGYSLAYATNRANAILVRKDIEDKWVLIGITKEEIGILTNQMHMGTFDISIDAHKAIKGFPEVYDGHVTRHKGILRPALTPMELAVITFAESVTLALHEERESHGFHEASRDVDDGASLARDNRIKIEQMTGAPVVSSRNMLKAPDGGIFGDMGDPYLQLTDGGDDPEEGC